LIMPAEPRTARTYRLPPDTLRQIDEIAADQHGLADVRVIEWAVEHLHRSVCRPAPATPMSQAEARRRIAEMPDHGPYPPVPRTRRPARKNVT